MSHTRSDLRPYLAVLLRRWTVILPALVLVPVIALLLASRQQRVYSATAQVLLTYSSPGESLNGLASPYPGIAPDRNVATQTALARDPGVARAALALAHVHQSPSELLNESTVSTPTGSDLLNFTVTDSPPRRAVRLATDYAQAYTDYRSRMDSRALTTALAGVDRQLTALVKQGQTASPTYRTLSHDQQALLAAEASGTSDAVVAQPAQEAVEVGPHVARSAAIGLLVGIALAAALAFLLETFDQRAGTEEIARRLRLPRLASIPAPRPLRRAAAAMLGRGAATRGRPGGNLAVVAEPNGREARAFHAMRSSLQFVQLGHDFKSLLLTSARPYSGQPETVANLAVVMAQSGSTVLLCDLSARQPGVGELFALEDHPGVHEVVLGGSSLEEAVVAIEDQPGLSVLTFGAPPPHAGFLGTRGVAELLEQLKGEPYDLVLIEAPPLLDSGDAQTLSTTADGVIVALPAPVRRSAVIELSATLARLPALALGFVTVGVSGTSVGFSRAAGAGLDEEIARELAPVAVLADGRPQDGAGRPPWVEALRSSPRYAEPRRDH